MKIRGEDKKLLVILLVLPLMFAVAYAQGASNFLGNNLQNALNLGVAIKDVFNAGKIFEFLQTMILLLGIIWFITGKLDEKYGGKREKGVGQYRAGGYLMMFFLIFLVTPRIARWVVTNPNTVNTIWFIAWGVYIYFTTFFLTSVKEGEKHNYAGYAYMYFIISSVAAPFNSFIKGADLETIIITHGFIAFFVINWWPQYREKQKEKAKLLEEENKQSKIEAKEEKRIRRAERAQLRIAKIQARAAMGKLQSEKPMVDRLQEATISSPGNFALSHPFLVGIIDALPKENLPKIDLLPKTNARERIARIQKDLENIGQTIRRFKDNYGETTNAGKEARRLLVVRAELKSDLNNKRLDNWTRYVGTDWDKEERCDFADELTEFGTPEHFITELKKNVKNGPEIIIKIIERRLSELQKQRKEIVNTYVNSLKKINEVAPEFIESYKQEEIEVNAMNTRITQYNLQTEQINALISSLKSELNAAADANTSEQDRATIIRTKIIPDFNAIQGMIAKLEPVAAELELILNKNEKTTNIADKLNETIFNLKGLTIMLRKKYGIEESVGATV